MGHQDQAGDRKSRFESMVVDAKRSFAEVHARAQAADEPHHPVRAVVVNSVCFLLPACLAFATGSLFNSILAVCLSGLVVPAVFSVYVVRSGTLGRWVINGAVFTLYGALFVVVIHLTVLPVAALSGRIGQLFGA